VFLPCDPAPYWGSLFEPCVITCHGGHDSAGIAADEEGAGDGDADHHNRARSLRVESGWRGSPTVGCRIRTSGGSQVGGGLPSLVDVGQAGAIAITQLAQGFRFDFAVHSQSGQPAVREHVEPHVRHRRCRGAPKKCRVSGCSLVFGTSSTQAASSSRSAAVESIPRREADPAELPMK